MNAPTSPVTENVAELDSTENEFPSGDDLAMSRATDFYRLDELLTDTNGRSGIGCGSGVDTEVSPIAADYWEAARVPRRTGQGLRRLGIAGGSIVGTVARGCRSWPRG